MPIVEGTAVESTVTPVAPVTTAPPESSGVVEQVTRHEVDERISARLEPWGRQGPLRPRNNLLEVFAVGLLDPLKDLYTVARGEALNVNNAPSRALPWLAQIAGVVVRDESPEQLRQLIRTRPPALRGTPAAMVAAVQTTLSGNKTVRMLERDPDQWGFTIITRLDETGDPAATRAAIASQTPAGYIGIHLLSDAPVINEGTRTIDNAAAGMTIDSATLAHIVLTKPNEPTGVSATAGVGSASVAFTPPADTGGSPILDYRVTSTPGAKTATGTGSPITVTGLTAATSYTFTVAARNAQGFGPESAASNAVSPT